MSQPTETFTTTQRILLGIISATMLTFGVVCYLFFPQTSPALTAILIRVGTVLGVIWLAFPQLRSVGQRLPIVVAGGALVALVIMAARPNLFKVAAALMVLLTVLSLVAQVVRKIR